ncbi:MAG: hypothetical protein U0234_30620 [Sandaracinus sp.]
MTLSRGLALASALVLLACGSDADPASPPEAAPSTASVDRSPGERPASLVAEASFDGGDAALSTLIARLPPIPERAGLPSRIATVLDGLLETPVAIRARVDERSPLRLLVARVGDRPRSAVAVRLSSPVPIADRRPGGPRGAWLVGEHAAVDDTIAVIADDDEMLALSLGYLAYTALPREGEAGALVVTLPAETVGGTVRDALERAVRQLRGQALASAMSARAAHARPPELGDPEALVSLLADAVLARTAYLPDLGETRLALAPTASGLSLRVEADVTESSPLADALRGYVPVATGLVTAAPSESAIVIASGTSLAARRESADALVFALTAIAGDRLAASERVGLTDASTRIAEIRGPEGALALGVDAQGAGFALALTRGGTDAAAPTPWGRAFPWSTGALATLLGCAPAAPRGGPDVALCAGRSLATRVGDGARADALASAAGALAEHARDRLLTGATAESPDLARDLSPLDSPFFLALIRPLRALPLLALLDRAPAADLPRGDGALVLAFTHDAPRLRIDLRASTAALADLDVVRGLFAEAGESE